MISEDVAKLILEIEDGSFTQKAGRDVELVGELTAAMGRGEIAGQTYDAMLKKVAATAGSVGTALEGGGEGGGGAGGGGSMAQRVQSLTYAFQDFTSAGGDLGQKLNSITNNIPGILAGFGSMATGIGFLITAGVALYRNWDELTVGAEEMKRRHDEMTKSIKEETAALEALEKVRTEAETKARAARIAGVAEAIAPDKEVIRKALAEDIRGQAARDIAEREAEIRARPEFAELGYDPWEVLADDPKLQRLRRIRTDAQRRADVTIGRAIEGGAPELGRLRRLFGPETAIGERLALAGPEAAEEAEQLKRAEALRKRTAATDAENARHREQMERRRQQEEQAAGRREEASVRAAEEDVEAERRAAATAARHAAAAAQACGDDPGRRSPRGGAVRRAAVRQDGRADGRAGPLRRHVRGAGPRRAGAAVRPGLASAGTPRQRPRPGRPTWRWASSPTWAAGAPSCSA